MTGDHRIEEKHNTRHEMRNDNEKYKYNLILHNFTFVCLWRFSTWIHASGSDLGAGVSLTGSDSWPQEASSAESWGSVDWGGVFTMGDEAEKAQTSHSGDLQIDFTKLTSNCQLTFSHRCAKDWQLIRDSGLFNRLKTLKHKCAT